MVQQQMMNVLRHLQKTHGILNEEVTEDPPYFQIGNTFCSGLVYVTSVTVSCEPAKGVY